MDDHLSGQVALVTGGGSGIGRAIALGLAGAGATVVVSGRSAEPLWETVRLIEQAGGKGAAVTADVSVAEDVARLIDTVATEHGRLHVAVNNAGVLAAGGPLASVDQREWTRVVDTNLTGTWLSMKHEINHMVAQGGGTIVNVSSAVGPHVTVPMLSVYGATKAAVSVLTRTAAREYIGAGVRINAVSPGLCDTPMSLQPGETEAARAERARAIVPLGRVATVDEVANAVLWLISPASSFAVGVDLVLDGGATA